MKFHVNENCIGCGLCAGICPDVFEMTDDGFAKAAAQPENAETQVTAREAMENCPVDAIEEQEK